MIKALSLISSAVLVSADNSAAPVPSRRLNGDQLKWPIKHKSKATVGVCSGKTQWTDTAWKQHNSKEIYLDVDTSHCGFTETPVYVCTMGGDGGHWTATGASEIHKPTKNGFRVYLHQESGINTTAANDLGWRVSWIAEGIGFGVSGAGVCAGKTSKGNTVWQEGRHGGIFVDIDTSECGFNGTKSHAPLMFGSVVGQIGKEIQDCIEPECNHLSREEVFQPTDQFFRMYIMYKGMTPKYANQQGLHINWVGLDIGTPSEMKSAPCSGKTDWRDWKEYKSGIYKDVDISACGFTRTPVTIASLEGDKMFWKTTGTTELYMETAQGFRVYVRSKGTTPKMARDWKWRISWMSTKAVMKPAGDPRINDVV